LYVATWRPLAEFGRNVVAKDPSQRKAKRDTWRLAPLKFDDLPAAVERAREKLKDNPAFVTELERRGRQWALVYKALVLTGLRRRELASLTVGSLRLEGPTAYATLEAAAAKNWKATGTYDHKSVAPNVAPNLGKRCILRSTADTPAGWEVGAEGRKNPTRPVLRGVL
jgi:hypothetical protein